MALRIVVPLVFALAFVVGCRSPDAPTPANADGAGGAAAPQQEAPPPPPAPVEAPFEATAIGADGERIDLAAESLTTGVPADARFELQSPRAFRTLRIRLFDSRDRLVPSTDEFSIGTGTRVRLVPDAPLVVGGSYRLLVDDARESLPRDIEERAWLPRSFRFTVAAPAEPGSGGGGGGTLGEAR